jgi:hypothetical protein
VKGTPATAARPAASAALLAALLLATTACSSSPSGPTAAQAGKWLRTDIPGAIKLYNVEHGSEPPFTVTSDGTKDIPCGKGKARRMYSTQRRIGGKDITNPVFMHTRVEDIAGFLGAGDMYVPDSDAHDEEGPITVTQHVVSTEHHARALITGKAVSGDFVITLEATSDCLRTS